MPDEAAGCDRHDEHDERVEVERRSHRKRLHDVLQQPVRQDHDHEHDQRRRGSMCAERDHDGERSRHERADERNIRADERHHADRAGERHVEDQRAERDHRRVEARDDGHAAEVAAQ